MRRAENQRLLGDERLTGTKHTWLRHPASFSEDAWREFRALRESNLKTARAWALKETAMRLFDYRRESAARAFFEQWRGWASRSRLTPMVRNQQNFINAIYFHCGKLDLAPSPT